MDEIAFKGGLIALVAEQVGLAPVSAQEKKLSELFPLPEAKEYLDGSLVNMAVHTLEDGEPLNVSKAYNHIFEITKGFLETEFYERIGKEARAGSEYYMGYVIGGGEESELYLEFGLNVLRQNPLISSTFSNLVTLGFDPQFDDVSLSDFVRIVHERFELLWDVASVRLRDLGLLGVGGYSVNRLENDDTPLYLFK